MNAHPVIRSALASAAALGLLATAGDVVAQPKPKEACFGITKRGLNECTNLSGTHSCAGQSRVSHDPTEWRYVPAGTCKAMGGMLRAEAQEAFRRHSPEGPRQAYPGPGYEGSAPQAEKY